MSIQTNEAVMERTAFMLPTMMDDTFTSEEFEDMEGLQMSFQRVKIPGGGVLQFEMVGDNPDNPEYVRNLEGVILYNHSSNAYWPDGAEYSVFGSCLDGKSDPCLRLDRYMAEEHGGKNGWIIEDCCLVGWLVSTFQAWRDYPEELKEQQLYYSHTEALDAMMQKLCEKGGLDMNTMKFKYSIQQGRVRDDDCWLDATHATLYDDTPDKWSWDIRIVRIYGPLKIVFEDIKEDKKNG